jgi:predicted component of type VI protein secretion system
MMDRDVASMPGMAAPAPTVGMTEGNSANTYVPGQKVIKHGSLEMRVKNADEAAASVAWNASDKGGSVEESAFYQDGDRKAGRMTVRVPAERFEETFQVLKSVATLTVRENMTSADVGRQVSDLEARLRNKQAEEASYQNLLEQTAQISDTLEITRSLANVRTEIEILQAELRSLESRIDMATISVSMREDARATAGNAFRPGQTFQDSLKELLQSLAWLASGLIAFVIVGLPLLLIFLLILWAVYLAVRRILRRMWPM